MGALALVVVFLCVGLSVAVLHVWELRGKLRREMSESAGELNELSARCIRLGKERDALEAKVVELERRQARLGSAPTADPPDALLD